MLASKLSQNKALMKNKFYFALVAFFLITAQVNASPVVSAVCEGGGVYGHVVAIKLSPAYKYGKLTIKRANAGADYVRDLSTFTGGTYKLDLAPKGGITGFTLEYSEKDASTFTTEEGTLTCGAPAPQAPAPVTPEPTTQPATPAPTTEKTEEAPVTPPSTSTPTAPTTTAPAEEEKKGQ